MTHHRLHPREFATEVLADGSDTVLTLAGELDIATAGRVRAAVHDLWHSGIARILVDLRSLDFMDSQGPRVLFDLQDESGTNGNTITLVAGQHTVQRVFELTRTSRYFDWDAAPDPVAG